VVVEADDVGVGPAHPLDVVEELSICPCGAIKPCHLREPVFSRLRERSMVLLSPEATISTDKVPYLPICRRRSSATRRAPKEPPVLGLEFIAEGVEIDDQ
jgi:hypothetical protein